MPERMPSKKASSRNSTSGSWFSHVEGGFVGSQRWSSSCRRAKCTCNSNGCICSITALFQDSHSDLCCQRLGSSLFIIAVQTRNLRRSHHSLGSKHWRSSRTVLH